MRLIDADKLHPDCLTKDGTLAISQSQIANASTIEGFVCEDEYGMVGIEYKKVVIERTFKDEHGEMCRVLHICEEDQND